MLLLPALLAAAARGAATPCSNSSAWRSGVILGNGQMAPVKPAPSAAVCCSRCAALSGCGCWTFATPDDPRKALQCILKAPGQCHGSRTAQHRVSGTALPAPQPPPPPLPPTPPAQGGVTVTPPAAPVPVNGIAEWTLTLENATLAAALPAGRSVWEALNVTLGLSPPAGATPYNASHRGFLYAGSEWRVRAALRSPGQYSYTLTAAWVGNSTLLHSSHGTAACSATAPAQNKSAGRRGFLRPRFGRWPYRTAYEDGTLFTGLGLGDCLNDQLTFLTYNETDGGQFNRTLEVR